MNPFEGSYGGSARRIHPASVLECGVCWWVYDPTRGDDTWQVPAGTAFADLPGHWRCPCCDAAQEQFMVLSDKAQSEGTHQRPIVPPARQAIRQHQRKLMEAYGAADERMRRLPVYNDRLDIQIVGLQQWQDGLLGIVATPWCMNILLLPEAGSHGRMEGTSRDVDFPSGSYPFIAGQLEGYGSIESCSLFSPMEQFDDPAVVAQVARHALVELLREPEAPSMSRRGFLRGGQGQGGERVRAG